jgi:hypothetical protein
MVRDMDLIRTLLLYTERVEGNFRTGDTDVCEAIGTDAKTLGYHAKLLGDAALVEVTDASAIGRGHDYFVMSLTWQGHEFLDSVRDKTVWDHTKSEALKAGGFSIDLLKALAKGYIKQKIKTNTGIELDI